jgi:hypothetical protein
MSVVRVAVRVTASQVPTVGSLQPASVKKMVEANALFNNPKMKKVIKVIMNKISNLFIFLNLMFTLPPYVLT